MKAFSGNEGDRKSLMSMIESLKKGLCSTDKVYHVLDSAFYTKENLRGGWHQYFLD